MQKLTVVKIVIVILALLGAYISLMLTWAYSTGDRVGYVQKFSRKGWFCKTWEGDQVLQSPPGTVAEKFVFTVRDRSVASRISLSFGRKVALKYEQHKGLPGSCFGDTEYFVVDVRVVE